MQEFKNKVAVITGGASGIGRALAQLCAQAGMRLALADVDEPALNQTAEELTAGGAEVLAVVTDVSQAEQVENLAQKTMGEFGGVHLLFNNAGVGIGMELWNAAIKDWDWILGVNLFGVIHGIRAFTPIMLAQDEEAHIINTASVAGLISPAPGWGLYAVSKHSVVALSETLYKELAFQGDKVHVSVLCPGFAQTQIANAERSRPAADQASYEPGSLKHKFDTFVSQATEAGITAEQVAQITFEGIRQNKFYILTDNDSDHLIEKRMQSILGRDNP